MFPGEMLGAPEGMMGSAMPNITSLPASTVAAMSMPQQISAPRVQAGPNNIFNQASHMYRLGRLARPFGLGMGRNGYNSGRMGMMGMDTSTGVNPDDMDMSAANALLGQFGQHMPDNPSPYAMLPNSGFFGRHQRIGGALEGALFGAANTGPADTWGEGISNVARGVIGGNAERQRAINQQFSQPFAQAMQMGQLQHLSQMMKSEKDRDDLNAAHEELYSAQAQKALKDPSAKFYGLHTIQDPQDPNYGKLAGVRIGQEDQGVQMLPGQQGGFSKPSTAKNDFGGLTGAVRDELAEMKDDNQQPLDPTKRPDPKYVAQANARVQAKRISAATASASTRDAAADARQIAAQTYGMRLAAARDEMIPKNADRTTLKRYFPENIDSDGTFHAPTQAQITAKNKGTFETYHLNVDGTELGTPGRSVMPSRTPAKKWNPQTGAYE